MSSVLAVVSAELEVLRSLPKLKHLTQIPMRHVSIFLHDDIRPSWFMGSKNVLYFALIYSLFLCQLFHPSTSGPMSGPIFTFGLLLTDSNTWMDYSEQRIGPSTRFSSRWG